MKITLINRAIAYVMNALKREMTEHTRSNHLDALGRLRKAKRFEQANMSGSANVCLYDARCLLDGSNG